MSMFDDVENLPGVICEINSDSSLGYDTSKFGKTDSVVIIGTAFKGQVGKPIPIYTPAHAAYMFGDSYNSKTKKEATLTAGLQAAYDSGCRTLYGVRVSGSDIYKDFNLCTDSKLKLRVRSYTPNNTEKECYVLVDLTSGAESFTLYKPASEATYAEKSAGLVDTNKMMKVDMRLNLDYGKNVDDKLVDVINIFNDHAYNLSLVMSIVDEDGNDVTTSREAQELCFGAIYPGVYFIGRDKSACDKETEQKFVLVNENTTTKPYSSFDGVYFRKLVMNTDVSQPLPIYYNDIVAMRSVLKKAEITMVTAWDFLAVTDAADKAFLLDDKDYEEVDISKFELYKKLGSGFVTTACAVRRTDDNGNDIVPKVKQTPSSNGNSVVEIDDGIYSVLQNESIAYRVLTYGNADDKLVDPLPKAKDFLTMQSNAIKVFQDSILAQATVDSSNRYSSKAYKIRFEALKNAGADNFNDIYTDVIAKEVANIKDVKELSEKKVESGIYVMLLDADGTGHLKRTADNGYENLDGSGLVDDLFITDNTLYVGTVEAGKTVFKPVTTAVNADGNESYKDKEYVLAESDDCIYAYQIVAGTKNVMPLGDLESMVSDNEDKTTVYVESNYWGENQIIVRSAAFSALTMSELVDYLNNHKSLRKLFKFSLTEDFSSNADDIVTDVIKNGYDIDYKLAADRELTYDYTKYIPYKTTDNLARQFAQHCTYTKITTGQTHGVIGLNILTNTTSVGVANRVSEIRNMDFDLYAKNAKGGLMLMADGTPYPIGSNISIPVFQVIVTMADGTEFTSNGAPSYAGMVSALDVSRSSTNQEIVLSSDPVYTFTNFQLGKLTDRGFITIKNTLTKGYVITDGITMAPSTSHFRRLSITRIMGYVEKLIRAACEPYIGLVNNTANRNAMQTSIKSSMDDIKDGTGSVALISDYEFNMSTDVATAKLNNIAIEYMIIPLYEIRQVKNTFTIKDQS